MTKQTAAQVIRRISSNFLIDLVLIFISIFLALEMADAATPMEQVKGRIDEILAILDDAAYRSTHTQEELYERLRLIVHKGFDWEEVARRALGLYWKERSPHEKKEFTELFSRLLEDTYITKIINHYSGEKVFYDKEMIEGEKAQVDTRVKNQAGKEVSVIYRLMKKGGDWVAYDVIIEGVSMVKNYRVQFYTIIRQSSYLELLKKLKEKQVVDLTLE